jgi:hypothetical protein
MTAAPNPLPPHARVERDPLATIAVSAAPVVLEGRYRLLIRALWELVIGVTRAVFVASRGPLASPALLEEVPMMQRGH